MAFLSAVFSCFVPNSSSSSRVSDNAAGVASRKEEQSSSAKSRIGSKSKGAPIVASYFPLGSNLSRL
ncbi:hypothetical protein SLEP1_g38245 [Rubroshorea leprosula]|uniref:Secreted protein n=1 Tax=Rubroshorea leprosula TaxID=152421 RepID=A0AAV5KXK5_9ROSI|nr:hypothetical protein SLEP1_g38245 [Rubroshorea leprosula]